MQMLYPGYGFLSENANFSRICQKNGIKFIGASPEQIEKMGDKATAKATMKAAGVPCIPGSEGLIASYEEAAKLLKKLAIL
jgi:acetyl-CoA carboxylase biotin carboxylase subunit